MLGFVIGLGIYFSGAFVMMFLTYVSNRFPSQGEKTELEDAIYVSILSWFAVCIVLVAMVVHIVSEIDFRKFTKSKIYKKLNERFTK